MMYRRLRLSPSTGKTDPQAIAIGLFSDQKRLPAGYTGLDQQLDGLLSNAITRPELTAEAGQVVTLYAYESSRGSSTRKRPTSKPSRVYVLGLGKQAQFNSNAIRRACAVMSRTAFAAAVTSIRLELTVGVGKHLDGEAVGRAAGEGLSIGTFDFDLFRGQAAGEERGKKKPIDLVLHGESVIRQGLKRGLTVGESVNLSRTLAATPPNVANPSYLVAQCRKLARESGLKCTVIDAKQAKQLKLNGLLAVGAAGSTPPALICLEHRPGRASSRPGRASRGPIMLVGKAVTFDTGGYSLKPSASMDGMKYDKCGGMAVIGAMHAIAKLKQPQHVVGLIPTAENMVDEKAYRPGDILTMHNGVTVEVTNTDAEGRLILADALAYGVRQYKPRAVVDLATLTGGVVVALGSYCAGLFCNDKPLRNRLLDAGQAAGERLWTLPLWDEHKKQLKGTHSDIVNSAGREAHPIQGAAFLSYFVDPDNAVSMPKTPWAHVDVAGVSDVKDSKDPLYVKGPTGFGVRLLVQTLEHWK